MTDVNFGFWITNPRPRRLVGKREADRRKDNFLANVSTKVYAANANLTTLHPTTIANVGGSQPHENRQPFLVLNFIIALQGIFPSQN